MLGADFSSKFQCWGSFRRNFTAYRATSTAGGQYRTFLSTFCIIVYTFACQLFNHPARHTQSQYLQSKLYSVLVERRKIHFSALIDRINFKLRENTGDIYIKSKKCFVITDEIVVKVLGIRKYYYTSILMKIIATSCYIQTTCTFCTIPSELRRSRSSK